MKFNINDILENRNGLKILIVQKDWNNSKYYYKYLNNSSPQFQGEFNAPSSDLEQYWTYAGKNLTLSAINLESGDLIGLPSMVNDKCIHEYVTYEGFTQKYKYCKKCDQKAN